MGRLAFGFRSLSHVNTHLKTTVCISWRFGFAPFKNWEGLVTLKKFTSNVLTAGISEHNKNVSPCADDSWAARTWPINSYTEKRRYQDASCESRYRLDLPVELFLQYWTLPKPTKWKAFPLCVFSSSDDLSLKSAKQSPKVYILRVLIR